MKISKISAIIGSGIVAVEAYVSLTLWIPNDAQFLADYFWSSIVPQNAIASLILLLPAIALLFTGPFSALVEKACFLYPLLLLAQFWLVSSTLDGLATPLIFVFFIAPISVFLAAVIFAVGRSTHAAKAV